MKTLLEEFGNRSADTITTHELATWLAGKANERRWEPATVNRFKALLSLTYRLGVDGKKVSANPAGKGLKRRTESNGRTRFLNQFEPAKTFADYLKPHLDEESRLRAVIATDYAEHMPEFEIALHTGMRPSEQYRLNRYQVDLARGLVTISRSKNGEARHIPLNSIALAAFRTLLGRDGAPTDPVFVSIRLAKEEFTEEQKIQRLKGNKHWFNPAVEKAGLRDFTWYCLRHTFASRLVMAGVDLPTVSYLMGHKTIQMTMKYAHLAPSHKSAAIERLVSFGKAPVSMKPPKPTDTKTDTRVYASL
jgi:integrase